MNVLELSIAGKSGREKATFLSLMADPNLPTSGEVPCEGISTAKMKLRIARDLGTSTREAAA